MNYYYYIENLIQREKGEGLTVFRPHNATEYLPVHLNTVLHFSRDECSRSEELDNYPAPLHVYRSPKQEEPVERESAPSQPINKEKINEQAISAPSKNNSPRNTAATALIPDQKDEGLSQVNTSDDMISQMPGEHKLISNNSIKNPASPKLYIDQLQNKFDIELHHRRSKMDQSQNKVDIGSHHRGSKNFDFHTKTFISNIVERENTKLPVSDKGVIKLREDTIKPDKNDHKPIENSMPTIRVSIGKIEVRAVSPPVSPRKTTPCVQPKMSLEDYLSRREGGSR